MRVDIRTSLVAFACSAAVSSAALLAAATSSADPIVPAPPDPAVAPAGPVAPTPPDQPAPPAQPLAPGAIAAPAPPALDGTTPPPGDQPITPPPNGISHLASPDSLPPGSTLDDPDPDSPNVSYLKDLMSAVQNHEISGKEALLMGLAQRGMNTPYPQMAPGPNRPSTPGDAPPPPPAPDVPLPPPPPAG